MRIGDTVKVTQLGENEFVLDPSGDLDGTVTDIRQLTFDNVAQDFAFVRMPDGNHTMAVPLDRLTAPAAARTMKPEDL